MLFFVHFRCYCRVYFVVDIYWKMFSCHHVGIFMLSTVLWLSLSSLCHIQNIYFTFSWDFQPVVVFSMLLLLESPKQVTSFCVYSKVTDFFSFIFFLLVLFSFYLVFFLFAKIPNGTVKRFRFTLLHHLRT